MGRHHHQVGTAGANLVQDGTNHSIFAQRLDSSGNALGTEFLVNSYTFGSQNVPFVEGDPEGRLFSEILVDVVAAEVIEPWGGGKWHMEIFRSVNPEPEDWNGEM